MLRAEPVPTEPVDSNDTIHRHLARANASRFAPRRTAGDFDAELEHEAAMRRTERTFVEAERAAIKAQACTVPSEPTAFIAWFESIAASYNSACEALFTALASASVDQVPAFAAPRGPALRLVRWREVSARHD